MPNIPCNNIFDKCEIIDQGDEFGCLEVVTKIIVFTSYC
jgi:hypothetical protein